VKTTSAPDTFNLGEVPGKVLGDPLHNAKIIKHLRECDEENDSNEL
jgi:hypothetical protein